MFQVGVTRDFLQPDGSIAFGDIGLARLNDAPHVRWEFLPDNVTELTPDHAHLVIARHRYPIEQIGNLIKGDATRQLRAEKLHPFEAHVKPDGTVPPCFARKWWAVFQFTEERILESIDYVNNNPIKEGLKSQMKMWPFVVPYPQCYRSV